jgi:Spy/CpxP family protein refolding chaperone
MNRRAIVLVVGVLWLGIALGAVGTYAAFGWRTAAGPQRPPGPGKGPGGQARAIEQLTREVGLTPQQQEQLKAILEESKARYDALFEQMRPQLEEIRQQGRQKIRAILAPEQLPKFEEHVRRNDEQRKNRGNRR